MYKRTGWPGKDRPHPHLSLKAEDGDTNGYHSSDDHCYDDSFGLVRAGEKEELRWERICPGLCPQSVQPFPTLPSQDYGRMSLGIPGNGARHKAQGQSLKEGKKQGQQLKNSKCQGLRSSLNTGHCGPTRAEDR